MILLFAIVWLAAMPPIAKAQAIETLGIAYLTQEKERPPVLYGLEQAPEDEGVQGARLAIIDNNTTGQFTGQAFELGERVVAADGDLAGAFRALVAEGYDHIWAEVLDTGSGQPQ